MLFKEKVSLSLAFSISGSQRLTFLIDTMSKASVVNFNVWAFEMPSSRFHHLLLKSTGASSP